jgi:hypothetical protein
MKFCCGRGKMKGAADNKNYIFTTFDFKRMLFWE